MRLFHDDCLKVVPKLPRKSVDLILCDLPFGVTQNKWDLIIPPERLWPLMAHVCKGAILLHAVQPFTSMLVLSNLRLFKYEWIWQKTVKTGQLNAKRQPLREHESILVFYEKQPTYNPQGLREGTSPGGKFSKSPNYGDMSGDNRQTHTGYPSTVLKVSNPNNKNVHPTQKPVALEEYLIRTYSNENDLVLDFCMGSGTTGVACQHCNRDFIGIEKDPEYFAIAKERLRL